MTFLAKGLYLPYLMPQMSAASFVFMNSIKHPQKLSSILSRRNAICKQKKIGELNGFKSLSEVHNSNGNLGLEGNTQNQARSR